MTRAPARFEQLPLDALGDEDQHAVFARFQQLPAYRADFALTRGLSPGVRGAATWLTGDGSQPDRAASPST